MKTTDLPSDLDLDAMIEILAQTMRDLPADGAGRTLQAPSATPGATGRCGGDCATCAAARLD